MILGIMVYQGWHINLRNWVEHCLEKGWSYNLRNDRAEGIRTTICQKTSGKVFSKVLPFERNGGRYLTIDRTRTFELESHL